MLSDLLKIVGVVTLVLVDFSIVLAWIIVLAEGKVCLQC